jgi:hypothetical protein
MSASTANMLSHSDPLDEPPRALPEQIQRKAKVRLNLAHPDHSSNPQQLLPDQLKSTFI